MSGRVGSGNSVRPERELISERMYGHLLDNILKFALAEDTYAGRVLLVTGAGGQIGLNIVGLALARAHK